MKDNKDKLKNHERSELTLFESRLHEGKGDYQKALECLQRVDQCADEISKFERIADIYVKLGEKDKAIETLE